MAYQISPSPLVPGTSLPVPTQFEKDFRHFEELKTNRVNWEYLWQRVADYVIPVRADYVVTRFPGQRRDQEIYDTTATWANEQLSAGLHTLLTSQALPWFYIGARDFELARNQDMQIWMADTQARLNQVFNDPKSRFQSQIHEQYLDLGAFGTGIMDVQFDKGTRFSNRFLGECYMAQTQWGAIDTMFRVFALPFHRVVESFGEKNLPAKFLDNHKDPFSMHTIIHACVPEGNHWASRYYLRNERACIKEGTFKTFPYITARMSHSNVETYGRGPGISAFADIMMVNEMKRTLLRSAHMAVDPPLLVPDGGYMQPIMLQPRAVNYYDTSVPGDIKYLQSKADFPIGMQILERVQQDIIRAFYVDMLQLPGGLMPGAKNQNTYMSATEATIRRENAMRVIGPIVSRLQTELLGPIITKVYNILLQQRALAPVPALSQGGSIDISYVSPLSIAQAGAEVDNWTRFFSQIQPLASLDPTVLDGINTGEVAPWLAGRYHLAPRLTRTPEQISDIQKQRQQQAAAQQAGIEENAGLMHAKRNTEAAKAMAMSAGQETAA